MDGVTQRSPWLDVPLADYEGHMSLPEIGQAQMIADFFASLLKERSPASVAVMGCSGGNGFDRIDPSVTTRVVGVDLNPAYVRRARKRFSGRFDRLELYTCDIQAMDALFEPVDMVYAALVFEYLDPPASAVVRMAAHLRPGGVLATILQLPSPSHGPVSPSPFFQKLEPLGRVMRFTAPEALKAVGSEAGLVESSSRRIGLRSGKRFAAIVLRKTAG